MEALEAGGYRVKIPAAGAMVWPPTVQLGYAGPGPAALRPGSRGLRPAIRAGVRWSAWNRSCVSVLRDELLNLWPTSGREASAAADLSAERIPAARPTMAAATASTGKQLSRRTATNVP